MEGLLSLSGSLGVNEGRWRGRKVVVAWGGGGVCGGSLPVIKVSILPQQYRFHLKKKSQEN